MEEHKKGKDDEISIKEIIVKIKEYFWEIVRKWWLILMSSILFAIALGWKAKRVPETYPAYLSFMINSENPNSLSSVSGLLGTFGLGGASTSEYNLDKMIQLLKSRKISEEVFFSRIEVNNHQDYIANHLINHLDTIDRWEAKKSMFKFGPYEDPIADFRFESDSIPAFAYLENKALKRLFTKVIGSGDVPGLLSGSYDEITNILYLSFTSQDEQLSIKVVKEYYENLAEFYTFQSVSKQLHTYKLIKQKSDSLATLLATKEYQYADAIQSNQRVFAETDRLNEARLRREVEKLNVMYLEATKNLEVADFSLKNKTPFIQTIDLPISPIDSEYESFPWAVIRGLILGGFIGILFVSLRKLYMDIMNYS
ncbi:GumC domain-containing protein [Portibacter marinus]|uniref:hypothetical protein n=1 Tax=Portibacter marinus TaxID=2898660 RepID=UPI001F207D39|nr:hypothetical protein [Portibacter marinus]